jgi:predicted RNA-binding Zn-ribbon protein involved in translation (DUF1610 family)
VKRIYIAADLADAQIALDWLGMRGIRAHVFNTHATGGLGELAATQIWPEVWVEDDEDAEQAMQLLKEIHFPEETGSKLCPQCGEENPGHFLSCWHCGQALV